MIEQFYGDTFWQMIRYEYIVYRFDKSHLELLVFNKGFLSGKLFNKADNNQIISTCQIIGMSLEKEPKSRTNQDQETGQGPKSEAKGSSSED